MSGAPLQVAAGSPEELSNAMPQQLLMASSTTSIYDLPTHLIYDILDMCILVDYVSCPMAESGFIKQYPSNIASLRLTCSMVNSWVLKDLAYYSACFKPGPTRTEVGTIGHVPELSSIPFRLLQAMTNLQVLDLRGLVSKFSSLPVCMLQTVPNLQLLDMKRCQLRGHLYQRGALAADHKPHCLPPVEEHSKPAGATRLSASSSSHVKLGMDGHEMASEVAIRPRVAAEPAARDMLVIANSLIRTGQMSEAPPQVAPVSPEELGNALSQLQLASSTTSLLDLPTHIMSSIVDILLFLDGYDEQPEWLLECQFGWGFDIGGEKHEDIASFRLACSVSNSLVLARATRMGLFGHKCPFDNFDKLWPLPVRLLQTMPSLQLLDLTDCGTSPLSLVGLPSTIITLNLGGSGYPWEGKDPFLDLSPLSKCDGLENLDISNRARVVDLSPLPACKYLDKPIIRGCGNLTSLSPLGNCTHLRILCLGDTSVTDLSPLSACKELEMVECSRTQVSDLSPLSVCLKLEDVECMDTNVSDISPLSACLKLRRVNCWSHEVEDITSLAACPQLSYITCDKEVIGLELEEDPDRLRSPWYSHPAFPEVQFNVPNA
eukprot:gene8992-biopygen8870